MIAVLLSAGLNTYWMWLIVHQLYRMVKKLNNPKTKKRRTRGTGGSSPKNLEEGGGGTPNRELEDDEKSLMSEAISEGEKNRQNYGGLLEQEQAV